MFSGVNTHYNGGTALLSRDILTLLPKVGKKRFFNGCYIFLYATGKLQQLAPTVSQWAGGSSFPCRIDTSIYL